MSIGTNKKRIEENNLKLENIKNEVSDLPDFVDTTDANAIATNITEGKTAYVNNKRIVGTMNNNGREYITPSENEQSLSNGYYDEIVVAPFTYSDYYIYCLTMAQLTLGVETDFKVVGRNLYTYYWGKSLEDRTKNKLDGTLVGSYTQNTNETITFSGGYGITGDINSARGAFEIYCMVNPSYTPDYSTDWFRSGCLVGCELAGTEQDFGIIIDRNGYFGIGYSTDSIQSGGVASRDGKFHHLVLNVTDTDLTLYIDGIKKAYVAYSMVGIVPTKYGIFWNNDLSRSIVKGTCKLFRYYTDILTEKEINQNYECCKLGIKHFEGENE